MSNLKPNRKPHNLAPGTRVAWVDRRRRHTGVLVMFGPSARNPWDVWLVIPEDIAGRVLRLLGAVPELKLAAGTTVEVVEVRPHRITAVL
jgi:hypothetical protein